MAAMPGHGEAAPRDREPPPGCARRVRQRRRSPPWLDGARILHKPPGRPGHRHGSGRRDQRSCAVRPAGSACEDSCPGPAVGDVGTVGRNGWPSPDNGRRATLAGIVIAHRPAVDPARHPGQRVRLALAALLGAAALGCGVALTATSAWLISAAALQPPVLTLMVAIVAVRAFGLGKGVLRYAERLVSHDAALRCGSALRVQIWAQLVRLGPAATARIRRGELLSRLVADVDAQQDLLIRVLLPATAAAGVGLATAVGVGLLLPAAGLVIAAGLAVAGILAPAAAAWAARRTEQRTAAARGDVLARSVEIIDGAADLLVCGAAASYRQRLDAADTHLGGLLRRAALARGLGSGLGVLGIGATAVAATAVGITALRDGAPAWPGAGAARPDPARARRRGGGPARRRGAAAHRAARRGQARRAGHGARAGGGAWVDPTRGARPPGSPRGASRSVGRAPTAQRRARRRPGPHLRLPAGAGRPVRGRASPPWSPRCCAPSSPVRARCRPTAVTYAPWRR